MALTVLKCRLETTHTNRSMNSADLYATIRSARPKCADGRVHLWTKCCCCCCCHRM